MDRNGAAWPVLFESWGSGQNVLYAYLSLPFLALFGLTPAALRLTAGVWGSLSLLVFWRLARRGRGPVFGLWALAALALNPWHLLLSRWALESNLLPALLLCGVWLLAEADRRPWLLLPAAAALALSLYAYGTAFLFLPVFLTGASLLLWRRRTVPLGVYLAALAVFILLAFPISLCNLRNALGLPEAKLFWMTLPRLTETRQSATVAFSLHNWGTLLRLLWTQSDGLVWNSAGPFGLMYGVPGLALYALGLGRAVRRLCRRRAGAAEAYLLLWLLSSLLSALFIDGNVNRLNMLFLPLVWYQAAGLMLLARGLGLLARGHGRVRPVLSALPALALALAAALMLRYYVGPCRDRLAPAFFDGLTEALACAAAEPSPVWVAEGVNMPYIFALFATKTPPSDFLAAVDYVDPSAAFRKVRSFGRFHFGEEPPMDAVRVYPSGQAEGGEILGVFGGYTVVKPGYT